MPRTLTPLLLALATVGVVTGGMLRPCDCFPGALGEPMDAPAVMCCADHGASLGGDGPARGGEDGLDLCRKGPIVIAGADTAPTLPAPWVVGCTAEATGESATSAPDALALEEARPPPGWLCWTWSPEGLSRFLI